MKKIVAVLVMGLMATFASCDAPTFWCLDDLEPGGPWTCHCKYGVQECADMGDCMANCPLPD